MISLTFEVVGMERVHEILQYLNAIGANTGAAVLNNRERFDLQGTAEEVQNTLYQKLLKPEKKEKKARKKRKSKSIFSTISKTAKSLFSKKSKKSKSRKAKAKTPKQPKKKIKRSLLWNMAAKKIASGTQNSEILSYLKTGGRDFITVLPQDVDAVQSAFVEEVIRRMPSAANAGSRNVAGAMTLAAGSAFSKINDAATKHAKEVARAGLIKAMKTLMRTVSWRIKSQTAATGSLKPLSKSYSEWKLRRYGFIIPIGVASGQLLDNINPDGTGIRNIRIVRETTLSAETSTPTAQGSGTSE